MKIASFDIVFQEIPGEVTLALNLSNCPCHCPGCHSPHLAEDIGEPLTEELLDALINQYKGLITCVAFMGGDADPAEVLRLVEHIKNPTASETSGLTAKRSYSDNGLTGEAGLKVAWYSGRQYTPETFHLQTSLDFKLSTLNYVKFGPYIESLGGLKSPTTNQRLYKRVGENWEDITSVFWRKTFE